MAGPSVIRAGDHYEMYYYALGKPGVFLATSPDGLSWERRGLALPVGSAGAWNEIEVSAPSVVAAQGKHWLYFTGARCSLEGKRATPYCDQQDVFLDLRIGVASRSAP